MKKLFAGIISVVMLFTLGTTAFADGTITEQSGNKDVDVAAKAMYTSPEDMYNVPVNDSKASVTTKSGAVITVSANDDRLDNLTLNIIEMVKIDEEAYSWISQKISGLCDKFTAYDIYFTDKDGKRVEITDEVTVSITTPEGYENTQVYHIEPSENPEKIDSLQSGGNTIFIANGFSYYVLADKGNDESITTNSESPSQPESQTGTNAPKTGDSSNLALGFSLLLVSCGMVAILIISNKRKKDSQE